MNFLQYFVSILEPFFPPSLEIIEIIGQSALYFLPVIAAHAVPDVINLRVVSLNISNQKVFGCALHTVINFKCSVHLHHASVPSLDH